MLHFAHIPKTGGTSLRASFVEQFGESAVVFDQLQAPFHIDPVEHPAEALEALEARGCKVLVNHCSYSKWAHLFAPEDTIAFVRDPVERVISAWHYSKRKFRENKWPDPGTLTYYAQCGPNGQCDFLKGLAINRAFVGVFERYEESLVRLNSRFGLDLKMKIENVKPGKRVGAKYPYTRERRLILQCNRKDEKLYQEVLSAW